MHRRLPLEPFQGYSTSEFSFADNKSVLRLGARQNLTWLIVITNPQNIHSRSREHVDTLLMAANCQKLTALRHFNVQWNQTCAHWRFRGGRNCRPLQKSTAAFFSPGRTCSLLQRRRRLVFEKELRRFWRRNRLPPEMRCHL